MKRYALCLSLVCLAAFAGIAAAAKTAYKQVTLRYGGSVQHRIPASTLRLTIPRNLRLTDYQPATDGAFYLQPANKTTKLTAVGQVFTDAPTYPLAPTRTAFRTFMKNQGYGHGPSKIVFLAHGVAYAVVPAAKEPPPEPGAGPRFLPRLLVYAKLVDGYPVTLEQDVKAGVKKPNATLVKIMDSLSGKFTVAGSGSGTTTGANTTTAPSSTTTSGTTTTTTTRTGVNGAPVPN